MQLLRNLTLAPARNPLDNNMEIKGRSFGFAVRFANAYAARFAGPGRTVVIVPCARGQTYLIPPVPGIRPPISANTTWDPDLEGSLFHQCVDRVNRLAANGNVRLVAFLWSQGENNVYCRLYGSLANCSADSIAPKYSALMVHLVHSFRMLVNLPGALTVPFITNTIQSPGNTTSCSMRMKSGYCQEGVAQAQLSLPSVIPNLYIVNTRGPWFPCDTPLNITSNCTPIFPQYGACCYDVHFGPMQLRWIADHMFDLYVTTRRSDPTNTPTPSRSAQTTQSPTPSPSFIPLLPPGIYDVIILAGQSNAVGRAQGYGDSPLPNVMQLLRNLTLAPARNPLDNNMEIKGRSFGFAVRFANAYAARFAGPGRTVVIVPCARGQTYLIPPVPGIRPPISANTTWDPDLEGSLFHQCVDRVNRLAANGNVRLVAFLWSQGENNVYCRLYGSLANCSADSIAPKYSALMVHLVHSFRMLVNLPGALTVPFITNTIQSPGNTTSCSMRMKSGYCQEGVAQAQLSLPSVIPNLYIVNTRGPWFPCDTPLNITSNCTPIFPQYGACCYDVHFGPMQLRWIADHMFDLYVTARRSDPTSTPSPTCTHTPLHTYTNLRSAENTRPRTPPR